MTPSAALLRAISGPELNRVSLPHDEARMNYRLSSITVRDGTEFEREVGKYVAYHFGRCVAPGARLAPERAVAMAKQIIENAYRRRHRTLQNAISDGVTGDNGGMEGIMNLLAEHFRNEAQEDFIEFTLSQHAPVDSYQARVELLKDLLAHYGQFLPDAVKNQPAERFASPEEFREVFRHLADAIRESAAVFQRV